MTTDTPKPQEQEEPFTRPFVVLAVTAIDRSVLSYRVIDADRNTLADRLSKEQAQWLCDRLNSAPPPSQRGDWMLVPREPTEAMLIAARDWSREKFGKPIGNDAAKGCYGCMLNSAPPPAAMESERARDWETQFEEWCKLKPTIPDDAKVWAWFAWCEAGNRTAIIAAHSAPAALPTLMEEEQWQVSYAMRLVDPKTGEDGGDSTIAASRLRTCLFNVLAIIDHIRAKP